jgi:hypothetical protein
MAVYEGARLRPAFLPGREAKAPAMPRRRARGTVRARRRPNRVGFVLGGIVLAFLLAFFSLAQSVRVSATSYDLQSVNSERSRLDAIRRDAEAALNRLGQEPAIRKQAIDLGLGQLPDPLIVPAR